MKHTEAKAFVRKYNAELAIRGYSKMKKADLQKTIENKLSRSREELQREWSALKAGPERPMAVKQGPRAGGPKKKQMGVKTPKRPAAVKKPVAKRPVAAKRSSENAADDAWHARNKDTSGQAQANRLNAVTDRLTRRAAMQRDKERIRRIRGR
jgi:hypothetical protein